MATSIKSVGIIGAGAMGFALIERLITKGFAVSVFDPFPAARDRASAAGATCLESAEDVFALGIPTIVSVAIPKAFVSTMDAIISVCSRGGVQVKPVIEASTMDPQMKEEAKVRLAAAGVVLLDCPVSGTGAQARKGDLVFFASGDDKEALAAYEPIFSAIGRLTIQAGSFGMGMRLKLLANHLVSVHSAVAAEALVLAEKAGLDPKVALQALTQSAATSRMLEVRGKLMVDHEYLPPTGSVDLIVKDGEMIKSLAQRSGCAVPIFDSADALWRATQAEELGSYDMAIIYDHLLRHNVSPAS